MSLGDNLRLLRARKGGITPLEIEAAIPDLPQGLYRQMEQRYRAVGDEPALRLLADFYGVSHEALKQQANWPRKALSRALVSCLTANCPIRLKLWNGDSITGDVTWWDLGAIGLRTDAGELVVQRHAVQTWDPPAPEPAEEARAGLTKA